MQKNPEKNRDFFCNKSFSRYRRATLGLLHVQFVAVPFPRSIGIDERPRVAGLLHVQVTFVEVDAVGRLRGQRKGDYRRMPFRGMVAVRRTFDICPLPFRGVRRIAADPPRFTAAAGVDRRLYDHVHSQCVAGAIQRRGHRAREEFKRVVPLPA